MISLITYFIYKNSNINTAVLISDATELMLLILSCIIVCATFFKLRRHKFSFYDNSEMNYNEALLIVGLGAIYLFGFYTILAVSHNGLQSNIEYLIIAIQIITILESKLLFVFLRKVDYK